MEFSLPSLFFLLLVLVGFTQLIVKLLRMKEAQPQIHQHKLPPGPTPWPIVGNLPEMLANKPTFRWIHKVMEERGTEIACIGLGNVHVISVTSPHVAREFLKKQDSVFASRPAIMSSELVSGGYLTKVAVPMGDQWKKMKKIMSCDLLSGLRHQWLHDKRVRESDNLVRFVYNQCRNIENNNESGGLVNVRIAARHFCGNVMRSLVFNRRYFGEGRGDGGPGGEEEDHVEAIFDVLAHQFAFCVSDYVTWLRRLDLDGHEGILRKAIGVIRKYHDPIIDDRIQQWKNGKRGDEKDLLDVLISLKDARNMPLLTSHEIESQIMEMMIASLDNPSNAFEWGLAEMLNQPELLQKATEELDNVVGKERLVQESDFPKLNYVTACAREAFRLHPIVPFIVPHVSMQHAVVANHFIPKGSHVLVSRLGVGRNPSVWDDPLSFKPERHLVRKNGSESSQFGSGLGLREPSLDLVTFSTGKRGCPAFLLGTSMTLTLFARLIHGFTWSVPLSEDRIALSECKDSMSLAKPLVAQAKPRLPPQVYCKLDQY